MRLGEDLLQDALQRIANASLTIAAGAVLVHSLDGDATRFWRRNGFTEFPQSSNTFFLLIADIVAAMSE